SVRGDEGAAGRLLPRGREEPGRGDPHGRQDSGRALRDRRGPPGDDLRAVIDEVYRAEWGRLLSGLIRAVGDFDAAEEGLADAFAAAVVEWAAAVPRNPRAWLYAT